MKLLCERIYKAPTYTISNLYIDGIYFSNILEDAVRQDGIKIKGKTAIPSGTYKVILNFSNRFKRIMPLLLDVPNYSGIRMHWGTDEFDTEGCLLVGKNTIKGKVTESKKTFEKLMEILERATDEITIEIK